MTDLTPAALHVLRPQHGTATTAQLRASGLSDHALRRLIAVGVLVKEYKYVLRLAGEPRTLAQRCAALTLAHPSAHVTGPTAGKLLGLRRIPTNTPITLAAAHPLHIEHTGVLLRRTTKLAPSDVQQRPDGIRIASPTRLAFDLAGWLGAHDHRSVVEQLIYEGLTDDDRLTAIGLRLVHPRRRGSRRFEETMASRSGTALESDPEVRLADALRARGVPLDPDHRWLDLPSGRRARLDLAVAEIRWGVEIDVHPHHLGVTGTTSDKARDREAHLIGWQIERVTVLDLADLDRIADELTALFHARRRAVA